MTPNEIYDLLDKKALLEWRGSLYEFVSIKNSVYVFRSVNDGSYMFCGYTSMAIAKDLSVQY